MMININRNGKVEDIKTQVFGCGYSIAGASLFTEIAKGEKADRITDLAEKELTEIEPSVPEKHISCINLSKRAYREIYEKYTVEKQNNTAGSNQD